MKGLLIFVGGFATGVVATLLYVKKKVLPDMREEVEKQCKEEVDDDIFGSFTAGYSGSDDVLDIVNEPKMRPITGAKEKSGKPTDYTKCFKDEKQNVDAVSKTEVKKEKKETEKKPGHDILGVGPYLIDADEFDNYSDYRARTFLLYSDGVVLEDEVEEILDADPELVFGKQALEELQKPENGGMVYVRNDETKSDYCLELRSYPFDGLEPPSPSDDWR